ncbi:MAG: hypothetical protein K9L87_04630 [Candidatus Omnitrophica bacterium]|nr:hypothetical protein [Candidatus Omnitrophota bacterium]MCF7895676.1 hypothetical protein [Candidatus Omnitrophota bacterium]MCF7898016.1 hypothetical protein [Candidatus Omnitrophota bacterium]
MKKTTHIIIKCPECSQRLRIPSFKTKTITVCCSRCNTEFSFNYKKYNRQKKLIDISLITLLVFFIFLVIFIPVKWFPSVKGEVKEFKEKYAKKISIKQQEFVDTTSALSKDYDNKILKLDTSLHREKLKNTALKQYEQEWRARNNYDSRYALSAREKVLLKMASLSENGNKNVREIIKEIATKAAPEKSTINVYSRKGGWRLDIDFDMSSLTSGERGTRTKHHTVESLKKEVIRLTSKVTNDIYKFCQDLGLEEIAIGCRHHVGYQNKSGYSYPNDYPKEENIVLYKVSLDKKDIQGLNSNPYLDIYSITDDFKIEKDEFSTIRIENL